MQIDRLQELIEVGSMLRIVLKVFIDHVQSAFKDSVEDFWHFRGDCAFQLVHDRSHCAQHCRFSCRWNESSLEGENYVEN